MNFEELFKNPEDLKKVKEIVKLFNAQAVIVDGVEYKIIR